MGQRYSKDVEIHGTVSPGYEPVKDMFTDNFYKGREESAQLCVYVGEEKVVDIWGSTTNPSYTADTLTTVFSSTKSLTAIAMAAMQDRGLVKYGSKIAEYWPEFAQQNKGDVTVADLMRHEAGLASFDTSVVVQDTLTEEIKKNSIGKIIETQKLVFPENGKRQYHAITRGWVANEIFRRVHPTGHTIGEFLHKEVSEPLEANAFVGIDDANIPNYAPVAEMKFSFLLCQSLIPKVVGRCVDCNILELMSMLYTFSKLTKEMHAIPAFASHEGHDMSKSLGEFFNQELVRRGESSSVNGNCSARGLATIAAAMANKGTFKGKTILSNAAWEDLHAEPKAARVFDLDSNFTQGGVNKFEEVDKSVTPGRDGYYGWLGYGGSIFQWHPQYKIGFGYTPTLLEWYSPMNEKGRLLQGEVLKCVEKQQKDK